MKYLDIVQKISMFIFNIGRSCETERAFILQDRKYNMEVRK